LPNGLTETTDEMLSCCTSLKTVIIPQSVNKICNTTFLFCENLTNVIFKDPQGWMLQDCYKEYPPQEFNVDLSNSSVAAEWIVENMTDGDVVVLNYLVKPNN